MKRKSPGSSPDFKLIRTALKRARRIGFNHRYGGLGRFYDQCRQALDALDRIEKVVTLSDVVDGKSVTTKNG